MIKFLVRLPNEQGATPLRDGLLGDHCDPFLKSPTGPSRLFDSHAHIWGYPWSLYLDAIEGINVAHSKSQTG
jgi:hypothetical protein